MEVLLYVLVFLALVFAGIGIAELHHRSDAPDVNKFPKDRRKQKEDE